MFTPKTIALSMAATAVLLAAGVARAGDSDETPVVPVGALAHATEELESSTNGKVLEIRLMDEKGNPAFDAAIAQGDSVVYMRIAQVTDVVTEIKVSELPPWMMNYKMEAYMRSIERAKVPLAQAIGKAEKEARGPAIGAGIAKPLSGTNAVLAYYIEVMKGRKRDLRAVDAQTGALIANPEAVYERWTPVKLARRLAP